MSEDVHNESKGKKGCVAKKRKKKTAMSNLVRKKRERRVRPKR